MATTLEDLERRLEQVEQDISRLRQQVDSTRSAEPEAARGARLLGDARMSQPAISAAVASAFQAMGITREPVGLVTLRQMMAACGIAGEGNAFSQEIEAMRDE
jgi:hypothetical protein